MPKEGFLDLYIQYTKKQESPEMFHLWCGLSVLSISLGRKCYINRGYYKLFPNLFTLLVAGAARCRKSTAIHISLSLLQGLVKEKRIKIISGKITPERFIDELISTAVPGEDHKLRAPDVLVVSSELSVLLTKQAYGEALIHILTDLFDCPDYWPYKTRNRGDVELNDVFISIIGATTPSGIANGISPAALQEGWGSRVLVCFQGDTERRNPFPELSEEEIELHKELSRRVLKINQLRGEFTLALPARNWFTEWYSEHMESDPADMHLDGMHGRKHDHLLRIAMLLAGSWEQTNIEVHHIESALMVLNSIELLAPEAFKKVGSTTESERVEKFKFHLRKNVSLNHSQALLFMQPVSAAEFRDIVETAIQSGWCKRSQTKASTYLWVGP